MNDEELKAAHAAAAPQIAPRDERLDELLAAVVAERTRIRRRSRRRWAACTAAITLLLGGASVAVASPGFREWAGFESADTQQWINDIGETCQVAFTVQPMPGVPKTDPGVVAAQEMLADINIETLPLSEDVLEHWRKAAAEEAEKAHRLGLRTRGMWFNDPDSWAIYNTIPTLIIDGVRDRGLDPAGVHIEGAFGCGGPA